MTDQPTGYGPPRLEGYSVEAEKAPGPAESLSADAPSAEALSAEPPGRGVRVVIHGEGFIDRAMPLFVMIGDVLVTRCRIAPDGRSVMCFLDTMPEEGATISVGYAGEERVELPERFSQSRVLGGDTE